MESRKGTSLIDLVISMGILGVLFGGIYLVYFSVVTAIANIGVRTAASAAIDQEIETIRNLPYSSVGTVFGVPSGVIPQSQTVSIENFTFTLQTTIRNIDDPFDGTLGGNPNDTAPNDYKLVSIQATCPLCANSISITVTTTVAPKNLESATQNGSLFLYALDANGNSVQDATMHVTNASVTPSIDLTDTTNVSGVLELVGVPTSTRNYQIVVTKDGFSSDQTYPPTASNPNPVKPSATVVPQTVTALTFSIDHVSMLTVAASDNRCVPIAHAPFSLQGSKMIGTTPDILKFSTSSATGATGSIALKNIEWDNYTFLQTSSTRDLVGTIPLSPLVIDPSSTVAFRFVLQAAADPSVMVTAVDSATGVGISNATATLSKGGFSQTLLTGQATFSQTDWSQGQFTSQSGGLDTVSAPGAITLLANASSTYATSTISSMISTTFDVGGASSTFSTISWNPVSEPPATGAGSLEFQVAANNDDATWSFIGPDGIQNTYFTASGASLPAELSGNRYFRYKIYMSTQDPGYTPELDDLTVWFSADCVPPAQALFTSLAQGNYTLDVTAQNYAENSTTISVAPGAQSTTISLTHL